jgi:hypothetical protein
MMPKPWFSPLIATFLIAAPFVAGCSPASDQDSAAPADPAQVAAKPAETPPAETKPQTKPPASATTPAKPPAAKPPGPPMQTSAPSSQPAGDRTGIKPTPVTSQRSFEVPQAGSLAETSDVVLNSKVRAALLAALAKDGQNLLAATKKGVVTLSGSVATPQLRAKAEQTVKKVRGVQSVVNRVAVKGK